MQEVGLKGVVGVGLILNFLDPQLVLVKHRQVLEFLDNGGAE